MVGPFISHLFLDIIKQNEILIPTSAGTLTFYRVDYNISPNLNTVNSLTNSHGGLFLESILGGGGGLNRGGGLIHRTNFL